MADQYIVVVEIDANGGNQHHVITAAQHAEWLARDDGTTGQDRDGYSDTQNRDTYSSATDPDDFLLPFVRSKGDDFGTWMQAAAHIADLGGTIANVIAAADDIED